jgi:hypothetical protein
LQFQRAPKASPEANSNNVPETTLPFSTFGLRFRSNVLEQAFAISGSYSYWIASQKMLVLAILICLLNIERESKHVVDGVNTGGELPHDTYSPLMFKRVRKMLWLNVRINVSFAQ